MPNAETMIGLYDDLMKDANVRDLLDEKLHNEGDRVDWNAFAGGFRSVFENNRDWLERRGA